MAKSSIGWKKSATLSISGPEFIWPAVVKIFAQSQVRQSRFQARLNQCGSRKTDSGFPVAVNPYQNALVRTFIDGDESQL